MTGGRAIELAIARPDLLDDAAFRRLRAGLPRWRRERADRCRRKADRYASVVAFSLLQYLWRERAGGPLPGVVSGEHGKPRFAGAPGWHFNWSHDASVCVCALGPAPLGVDVQPRVRYSEALFARIAAPGERHLAGRLRAADDLSLLWTRKEAAVKRTGSGLTVPLDQLDTTASGDILTLAIAEPPCHLSVTADGYTEPELRTALRTRFLVPAPGAGSWTQARPSRAVQDQACVVAAETEGQRQRAVQVGRL
ncbi:4'-phosphopantetheinyl transferase family protein [Myceligenerans crystallogenes]|uniref:4'-phosphopantetheinyl transferase domain-containing protein n=1 Tax=Myceligenerans crystallogenes TaxID=316335 RepID=A0ABN2N1V5_9MICO